jgi:hypothetical protein
MSSPRHDSAPARGVLARWAGVVALLLSAALAVAGQPGAAAVATASAARGRPATVAHTDQGTMTSKVVGKTSTGRRVTGTFTPLRAVSKHGHVMVKGIVQGVVHEAGGTSTFTTVRSVAVRTAGGQPLGRGTAAGTAGRASCDILHLVLGPLDLDLLGLQVHLNRVVLDVVAATGAGNLLGNLLCAITGLLDGTPAAGLLGQLVNLLNQVLAALRLGV